MSTSKYTPAPWRATKRPIDDGVNWASRIPFAIEREYGAAVLPIADVCDQSQAEANARLIAAAPDLLEALREMMEYAGIIEERCDAVATSKARAAIAKATGEDV